MEDQIPQTKPPLNRNREKNPRKSSERNAGSLDRRRVHHPPRHDRDLKSRSTLLMKSPSPRPDDFQGQYQNQTCQNWCCSPFPNGDTICYDNFHRRHERIDPQRYGSSPMLMEQRFLDRGSHPDLFTDCNRFRHEAVGCFYHMPPPCCCYDGRGYHWTPPLPKV